MYRVSVEKSEATLITQLKQLGEELRKRSGLADKAYNGAQAKLEVLSFKGHLYEPLIKASGATISVKPVALNDGEMRFVHRLKDYCAAHADEFVDKPLFLLRNMSKGRGVGFFEAGNFYPDFIVWRIDGDKQRITFVDPKGIRQLSWANEPKLDFHQTIREMETRMGDANVSLRSFIVSVTSAAEMARHWGVTAKEMADRNILFDEDEYYVDRLASETVPA
ncbi:DEAD/DEAH box helicase domain-containing protein [Rhodanobacter denitrificans]|nr:DEAD/DEAH box helicase domain-containing protein [Rhodanobacter denitrificans]